MAPNLRGKTAMNTPAVLKSQAPIVTLFKRDSPRPIDRLIDYFGDGRTPVGLAAATPR
jgi:hypothetical protein